MATIEHGGSSFDVDEDGFLTKGMEDWKAAGGADIYRKSRRKAQDILETHKVLNAIRQAAGRSDASHDDLITRSME